MRHRTILRLLVVMALAIAGLGAGRPASAGCAPGPLSSGTLASAEGELASLANGARANVGAGRLAPDGELAAVARGHAARMAEAGRIFHSDLSALFGALDATVLAENVGMGCAAGGIHEAFLASPSHRSNLLNGRLTHAGYGAASGPAGTLFVAQVFAAYPAPAAAPAAAPVVTPPPTPVPAAPAAPTPVPSTPRPTPDPTPELPTPEPATPEPTRSTPAPTAEPMPSAGFDGGTKLVSAAGSADGRLGGTGPHDDAPSGPLAAGAVLAAALALVAVWWSRSSGSTMWSR